MDTDSPQVDASQSADLAPTDSAAQPVETSQSDDPTTAPVAAVASDSDTPAEGTVLIEPETDSGSDMSTDASNSAPIDSDQTYSTPTAAPITTHAPSSVVTSSPTVPTTSASQSVLGNKASTIDKETFIRLGHEGRRKKKEAKLERIMKEAAKRGHLNSREAALSAEISLRTAETYLDELVTAGRLTRHSAGNATEYSV